MRTPTYRCHHFPLLTATSSVLFQFSHLIFDMTSVGFTDTASTRSLISLLKEYEAIDVACYLVGCNGESRSGVSVYCGRLGTGREALGEESGRRLQIFTSVMDAGINA